MVAATLLQGLPRPSNVCRLGVHVSYGQFPIRPGHTSVSVLPHERLGNSGFAGKPDARYSDAVDDLLVADQYWNRSEPARRERTSKGNVCLLSQGHDRLCDAWVHDSTTVSLLLTSTVLSCGGTPSAGKFDSDRDDLGARNGERSGFGLCCG